MFEQVAASATKTESELSNINNRLVFTIDRLTTLNVKLEKKLEEIFGPNPPTPPAVQNPVETGYSRLGDTNIHINNLDIQVEVLQDLIRRLQAL